MNINFKNNINFQKRLVAQGGILTNGKTDSVNIYHLDEHEDVSDLKKASKTPEWKGNYYLDKEAIKSWDLHSSLYNIFTIENENKDILCYAIVDDIGSKAVNIAFIETAPKISCYNQANRKSKYIGETMLAFLASKLNKRDLTAKLIAQRPQTINFYNHCGFKKYKSHGGIIENDQARVLINKNFKHTGKKIELIC